MKTGQKKISDVDFLREVNNGHKTTEEFAESIGIQPQSVASRCKKLREKVEAMLAIKGNEDSPKLKLAVARLKKFENVASSPKLTADVVASIFTNAK